MILFLESSGLPQYQEDSIFSRSRNVTLNRVEQLEELNQQVRQRVVAIFTRLRYNLDADVLRGFPSLRFLLTPTTGLNHIDVDFAISRGIRVISLRDFPELIRCFSSTVEVCWWHILELTRRCGEFQKSVGSGVWNRYLFDTYSLRNKKMGIVGFGRLGEKVAAIASAFSMPVFFSELNPERIALGTSLGYTHSSLTALFGSCHVISIHVDDRKENSNLINGEVLNHIKDQTPILINTSRGFILNEEDVLASLQMKKLSGLGVDVISDESNFSHGKQIQDNVFWRAKFMHGMSISITPHIGGATLDSMSASSLVVLDRLQTLLDV